MSLCLPARSIGPLETGLNNQLTRRPWRGGANHLRLPLAPSLDHLVRAEEQRLGDSEAERLGCFEIDGKKVSRRLLERQLGCVRALKNFVDVSRRAQKVVE